MLTRVLVMLGCCAGIGAVGVVVKHTLYSRRELIGSLSRKDVSS
ncbi:MAG: hypothetical protein ACLFPX_07715 [Candidatus Omnitrophota bacterium]